ncbi:hypothetical protein M422DRAFT_167119 [Sphaerobolus stellatus SS14]|uniref:TATA-binding protein interacting (TIP20) domain-containing protein n=1 Tax=Sphaerobolus stellatus (strain SS14) TaxID=990650 RepID=A0A0C9VRM1_SPHS4|nr:hypothetical protein M422DRAFT_167119 [Sphaerobolus stellatus SS14]
MSKAYIMNGLMEKMNSPDQDFRYMALNDLMNQIKSDSVSLTADEAIERKVLQHVMKLVQDKISEVKNQAVKCLGQLIKIIRESQMDYVVDSLIDFSGSQEEELRDIAGLALKTITSEIPQESNLAAKACARLVPKLLAQLQNSSTPPETLLEILSILSILVSRFPAHVSSLNLPVSPVQVMVPLLEHSRPAVRKRTIVTLAQFLPSASAETTNNLLRTVIVAPLINASTPVGTQRTSIQLLAAIARYSPTVVAPILGDVIPGILKASSQDDDEQRESSLQTLEALVLRCPTEVTPFLNQIISVGVTLIKYDPNYAGDDEDDDDAEMGDADDDDDDADLDDEYSDDEDTSYKIRRSATKLLGSVIGTRPELLGALYKSVSPVLISRFGDREESVRLEVWATYSLLVTQTGVYGGNIKEVDASPIVGKRKREEEGEMEIEESPYSLLRGQVPSLSKKLLKQLQASKVPPATLQAGFNLLVSLLTVLPGCLASQVTPLFAATRSVLAQAPTTATSSLHVTILSFLSLFFATHPANIYVSSLPTLIPVLLTALREKHPRVAAESFRAFSSLITALKPLKPTDWADKIYIEAVSRLKANDTDTEVRDCAGELIADLWISAPEVVKTKGGEEWQAMLKVGRTESSVKVIKRVAIEAEMDDQWINGCVEWVSNILKKSGRAGKVDAFVTLNNLISKYQSGVPADLAPHLIPQLSNYLTTTDIALLSQALATVCILLQFSPATSYPAVEEDILKDIYPLAHSPLVSGACLDSLLGFFSALVEADSQIASHVIPGLVTALKKADRSEAVPANVAKVVSCIVRSQISVAAGVIAEFSRSLKPGSKAPESQLVLSLLVLGELGRFIDMSLQADVFNISISLFSSESEAVRTAAAFAAGNMTIGNMHHFLPAIIQLVQSNDEKRLLALHAVKEVANNSSIGQLETIADTLWTPLFERSENAEEATRNVAAACLGKLTTANPSKYLPQLQSRLHDPSPSVRATVVSAIRYTFVDTGRSYDELLAPIIVEFLLLIVDENLDVRRLSLSALNAAARNKPQLIREHLGSLLPPLYEQTVINPKLIRTVQMGPWQHKVDDGLEARKAAYETMYTLLDTSLNKLDLHTFFSRVKAGLVDPSDEIKVLCHLMLFRLAQIAPTPMAQRLNEVGDEFTTTMQAATVTKDTVKQDLERTAELQRSALRTIAALSKISTPGNAPLFDACVESVRKSSWSSEFQELVAKP